MAIKKSNIEELEKQYLEAEKNFKALREQFEAAKKEEEENKKAKLVAEHEARHSAVVDAYKKFEKLRNEYVTDYGSFTFKSATKDGDSYSWFWNAIGLF